MSTEDYFYSRAEAELSLAQKAEHPAAVRAHYLLAGYYLDRHYGEHTGGTEASTIPAMMELAAAS